MKAIFLLVLGWICITTVEAKENRTRIALPAVGDFKSFRGVESSLKDVHPFITGARDGVYRFKKLADGNYEIKASGNPALDENTAPISSTAITAGSLERYLKLSYENGYTFKDLKGLPPFEHRFDENLVRLEESGFPGREGHFQTIDGDTYLYRLRNDGTFSMAGGGVWDVRYIASIKVTKAELLQTLASPGIFGSLERGIRPDQISRPSLRNIDLEKRRIFKAILASEEAKKICNVPVSNLAPSKQVTR
jgi:hypothetical protein